MTSAYWYCHIELSDIGVLFVTSSTNISEFLILGSCHNGYKDYFEKKRYFALCRAFRQKGVSDKLTMCPHNDQVVWGLIFCLVYSLKILHLEMQRQFWSGQWLKWSLRGKEGNLVMCKHFYSNLQKRKQKKQNGFDRRDFKILHKWHLTTQTCSQSFCPHIGLFSEMDTFRTSTIRTHVKAPAHRKPHA